MNKTIQHLLQHAKILNINITQIVLLSTTKYSLEIPQIVAHYGQTGFLPTELQELLNYSPQMSRRQIFTFAELQFLPLYDSDERIFVDLSGEVGIFVKELQGKTLFGMYHMCDIGEIRLLLSNCE